MDARELRIGNLVLDPEGLVSKILSISTESNSTDGKYYLENDYNGHPEDLRSIPLTEEWLLKFGFSDGYTEFKKGWFVICSEDGIFYFQFENYSVEFPDVKIKYVHQLQNLYFALTGEELTQ